MTRKWRWLGGNSAVCSKVGFIRGTACACLTSDDDGWLVVLFRDREEFWFRAGSYDHDAAPPTFYGPYATEDEAKAAAEIAFRMGALE